MATVFISGFSRSKRPILISTAAPPIQSPLPVIPHQKVGADCGWQAPLWAVVPGVQPPVCLPDPRLA